jgi:thiol-disulfide isomerase/thioredoxin
MFSGLVAWAVAWLVAAAPSRRRAVDTLWSAMLIGLVVARVVHVVSHTDAYGLDLAAWFDIRDGGWNPWAGWVAGAVWLARSVWREPTLRRAVMAGGVAALLVWLGVTVWREGAQVASLPDTRFEMLAREGETVTAPRQLSELAEGRPMVINLWATWCGPCRAEMPVLARAQRDQPEVAYVFVNQGEAAPVIQRYLKTLPDPLAQVLLDPDSSLGRHVASTGLPTTVFVDARGRVVEVHMGVLTATSLRAKVAGIR